MLATLERPIERLAGPTSPTPRSTPVPISPLEAPHCRPLAPVVSPPPAAVPEVKPVHAASRPLAVVATRARLRMTMRARRLLAALVLVCAGALGVVAVDLLAAIIPSGHGTSYAAQEEPYVADGAAGAADLAPASGSSLTVTAGDTLWSLAEEVDPQSDPRDLIAAIMTLNDLDSPTIVPGQVLRLP